ncbi:hypothetical protein FACS189419_05400 [Planctomycetales bacterium]|nr:hypothetical protein FACS189419_05400 [Planctomycetales bacterium]
MNRTLFLLFLLLFAGLLPLQAEPLLNAGISETKVYEGKNLHYQLFLSDDKPIPSGITADASALEKDFSVAAQQPQFGKKSNITQTNNGRASHTVYYVMFDFILTPQKTGTFNVPLPKLSGTYASLLPAKRYSDRDSENFNSDGSITVQILEPEKQDIVFSKITANKTKLYPFQPLEISLTIYIKALPSGHYYAERNPLTLVNTPPKLQIPWLNPDTVDATKGLFPSKNLETWFTDYLSKTRGFSINGLGSDQIDAFFSNPFGANPFQKVLYQFSGLPTKVSLNNADYWEYNFTRQYSPQKIGTYTFGPVRIEGSFPVAGRAEPFELKMIYAVAPPLTVTIADVPADKIPADYTGAFGTFEFNADVTPKKAKVGDPITLTLKLTGTGSTANVKAPELTLPEITDLFRVHTPPTEENDEQHCTYTYTIRPKKPGTVTFPSLSISVFDVEKEQFISLRSQPLTLDIGDSETVDSATVYNSNHSVKDRVLTEKELKHWAVILSKWAGIGIGSLFILYLLGLLGRHFFVLATRRNIKELRNKNALLRAKNRIVAAENGSSSLQKVKELQDAFFGYAADKTNCIEDGMTTAEAVEKFRELKTDETVLQKLRQYFEQLDAIQYGGGAVNDLERLFAEAKQLIQFLKG